MTPQKRGDAESAIAERIERVMASFDRLHVGKWLLGINVIVAPLTAGVISAGAVLITIIQREFMGGMVAAVAFTVSAAVKAYDSYRRSRRDVALRRAIKAAYRQVIIESKLTPN